MRSERFLYDVPKELISIRYCSTYQLYIYSRLHCQFASPYFNPTGTCLPHLEVRCTESCSVPCYLMPTTDFHHIIIINYYRQKTNHVKGFSNVVYTIMYLYQSNCVHCSDNRSQLFNVLQVTTLHFQVQLLQLGHVIVM